MHSSIGQNIKSLTCPVSCRRAMNSLFVPTLLTSLSMNKSCVCNVYFKFQLVGWVSIFVVFYTYRCVESYQLLLLWYFIQRYWTDTVFVCTIVDQQSEGSIIRGFNPNLSLTLTLNHTAGLILIWKSPATTVRIGLSNPRINEPLVVAHVHCENKVC